jgi:hypothetical protein
MGEREFIIYLDPPERLNRYRHYHAWQGNQITEFRIQYEAFFSDQWHPIVRYDSAHGKPHRDILHPAGAETKEWFTPYNNAEILTIGQRDIVDNWKSYRARYESEMRK